MELVKLPLAALEPDGRALIEHGGVEIAVFRVDGEIHAFENACPHEGNPLIEGEVLGPSLTCAYHGWTFDLETGACLVGLEAARRYPAEVRADEVLIRVDP